ncbi:MAG: hypothetical protein N2442_01915 [Spirochaetes bacterium]|nr:hypothetical protein [Spirochaetota bacterium]
MGLKGTLRAETLHALLGWPKPLEDIYPIPVEEPTEKSRSRREVHGSNSIRFILVATLWFTSCQTLPRWEAQNPWGLFPSDGSLYLYMPIPEHRDLLFTLLTREMEGSRNKAEEVKGITYFLDHTSEVFLVVLGRETAGFFSSITGHRWIFAGVGEYSSFLLRLALTPEEGWEQRKIRTSGYSLSYFQHRGKGLQVALPDTHLLIVSSGEIEFPLKQFVLPRTDPSRYFQPPICPDRRSGSHPSTTNEKLTASAAGTKTPFSLYIPKTGISLVTVLLESVIPIGNTEFTPEAFCMNLYKEDFTYYFANGSIFFQKAEQARSMSVLFRLAIAGWFLQQVGKGVPTSVQIRVNGSTIEFSGIPFSRETIAQFFDSMVDTKTRTYPW